MKTINNFSADNITFSEIKKNARGGKYVLLSDNGSEIQLKLPKLNAPFGINEPNKDAKEYSLNLSLTPELIEFFTQIDNVVLDFVVANSVALFGKTMSRDVLKDALMNSIVKYSKNPESAEKYAPTIKLKASSGEGKYIVDFFKSATEQVPWTEVKKGTKVESVIEIGQIWFINGKFGVSTKLLQAKIHSSGKLTAYAFEDDTTDDQIDIPDDI